LRTPANIFSLEWTAEELRWLVDDKVYYVLNLKDIFTEKYNPFNKKFYLIMNIAVGGDWPGNNIDASALPARMEIDYIRYYHKQNLSPED